MSEEEEERLIFDFNQTDTWYPRETEYSRTSAGTGSYEPEKGSCHIPK